MTPATAGGQVERSDEPDDATCPPPIIVGGEARFGGGSEPPLDSGVAAPPGECDWTRVFNQLVAACDAGDAEGIQLGFELLGRDELGCQSDQRVLDLAGQPRPTEGPALLDANILLRLGQAEIVRLMIEGQRGASCDDKREWFAEAGARAVVLWWNFWFDDKCKRKIKKLPAWKGLEDMLLYVRKIYHRQRVNMVREERRSHQYLAALQSLSPDKKRRLKEVLDSQGYE
jgi:hypothetical protein